MVNTWKRRKRTTRILNLQRIVGPQVPQYASTFVDVLNCSWRGDCGRMSCRLALMERCGNGIDRNWQRWEVVGVEGRGGGCSGGVDDGSQEQQLFCSCLFRSTFSGVWTDLWQFRSFCVAISNDDNAANNSANDNNNKLERSR